MEEIWKDIPEYEGLYQASNLGRIKSIERFTSDGHHIMSKILKPSLAKGYLKVSLCKDNVAKTIYVHRLVAKTFLTNKDNLPCINHKDENKLNNRVDNLEWCTHFYNTHYGTSIKKNREKQLNYKKTSKPVIKLNKDNEIINKYLSINEAMRMTKINAINICQCCKGKRKTAGGYIWRYADE